MVPRHTAPKPLSNPIYPVRSHYITLPKDFTSFAAHPLFPQYFHPNIPPFRRPFPRILPHLLHTHIGPLIEHPIYP